MVANKDLLEDYNILSNNIRFYQKKLGYTQEKLAEKAEVSISYIKQLESNKEYKNMSLTTILKLSKALNVNTHKLFVLQKF